MDRIIANVSYEMFKHFALENGAPGAEELTSDFLVFTGSVAGGAVNGAITQPGSIKLNPEYDYFLTEIRASANFLDAAAAAIGAQAYVPIVEAQHLAFNLRADGRTRSLFRQPIPVAQVLAKNSANPIDIAAPPAFSGQETVFCDVTNLGTYNPQAIAAQLDFTITCQVAIIKTVAIRAFRDYLIAVGRKNAPQFYR